MGPQGKSSRVQVANTKDLLTFSFTTDIDEVSGVAWMSMWWKWHAIVDSTTKQKLPDLRIQSCLNIDFDNGTHFTINWLCVPFCNRNRNYSAHVHPYHCDNAGCSQHYPSQSIFPPPALVLETSWLPFTEGEGKIGSLSVTLSLSRSQQMSTPAERPLRPADYASLPPIPRLLPHSPAEGQRASRTEGQQEWDPPWDRCRRGLRWCIKT